MSLEEVRERLQSLQEVVRDLQMEDTPKLPVIKKAFKDVDGVDMSEEIKELLNSITKYGDMNAAVQLHSLIAGDWKVSNCHGPDVSGRWSVALAKFPQKVVSNIMNYVSEADKSLSMAWMFATIKAFRQQLRIEEHNLTIQSMEKVK